MEHGERCNNRLQKIQYAGEAGELKTKWRNSSRSSSAGTLAADKGKAKESFASKTRLSLRRRTREATSGVAGGGRDHLVALRLPQTANFNFLSCVVQTSNLKSPFSNF